MAKKMDNIAGLFRESRTRVIVLVTIGLVLLTIFLGTFIFRKGAKERGPEASAQVASAPGKIESVPGGFEQKLSPEYEKLVQQYQEKQVAKAMQEGGAFVPTITRAEQIGSDVAAGGGIGFSALSRAERQGGIAKSLGEPESNNIGVMCADGTIRDAQGNIIGKTGSLPPCTVVYDDSGTMIGALGADRLVRNIHGEALGRADADGVVHNTDGKVIGKASVVAPGTLVFSSGCRVVGVVNASGFVQDKGGTVLGKVGMDGTARDAKGDVIGRSGSAAPGAAAYNLSGKIIGSLRVDGSVYDDSNKKLGNVCQDGSIRDAKGQVIAKAGMVPPGTPVYDTQGQLLGNVHTDGLVKDAKANIVGTVGIDGIVRDAKGSVVGRAGCLLQGSLIYDSEGRVIGVMGADGVARDVNGNVIGTVGADGLVRDANGKVIGRTSAVPPGQLVCDDKGNIIGTVGADSTVRDAQGNVIGKVGPDKIVRNANGEVIGKTSAAIAGALLYKENECTVIGSVGATGNALDLKGNVIGRVGCDGIARDMKDNVIGRAGLAVPGSLVSNSQGQVIGKVGMDGNVRNTKGTIIGKVCADGIARDAAGRIIGKVDAASFNTAAGASVYDAQGRQMGVVQPDGSVAPMSAIPGPVAGAPATTAPGLIPPPPPVVSAAAAGRGGLPSLAGGGSANDMRAALLQRQAEQLSAQQQEQTRQQLQSGMTTQANQLFTSWVSPRQDFVIGLPPKEKPGMGGVGGAGGMGPGGGPAGAAMLKAGTILFAVLDTAVNTDEPGPVLATVVEGPFKGTKVIGNVTRQDQKAMLSFTAINVPQFSNSVSVNAVAIDTNTARTALASEVDNHYWLRYGSMFASAFLQGYGQAVAQAGATISTNGFNTQTGYPALSGLDKIAVALGTVGQQWGAQLTGVFNTPPTVKIHSGTGLGILFMTDVQRPAM